MHTEVGDELWVVMYLHDWDDSGNIYPQVHSIHQSWRAAEDERRSRITPDKYYVARGNLRP